MKDFPRGFSAAIAFVLLGVCTGAYAQQLTLGGDAARNAFSTGLIPLLDAGPAWVFPASDPSVSASPRWLPETTVAIGPEHVYAISAQTSGTQPEPARLWAIHRSDGQLAWVSDLPGLVLDSRSSPTLDLRTGSVLIGAGQPGAGGGQLIALDAQSGSERWRTPLYLDVVNASVVVTHDLGMRNRAFITDYEGFYAGGTGAALYCINVDPFDSVQNPYQPGEVVWKLDLFDGASGASPTYWQGRVYVGTTGDFFAGTGGRIVCVDARASRADDAVLWDQQLGGSDGFFGGVCVVPFRGGRSGYVYAATYNFFGAGRSSRMIKLDALTGAVVWQVASDRTSTIPVVLDDGGIVLAAGVVGFGSVPRIIRYYDHGHQAEEVWDSAVDSWDDVNGNGQIDPGEYLEIGGWSNQPVVRAERGGHLAVVGGRRADGVHTTRVVDLARRSSEQGFVVSQAYGNGGSPAVGYQEVYSIGVSGVAAFGVPLWPDVNLNGIADIDDLHDWHQETGMLDVNLDGVIDEADRSSLEGYLRRNEAWDLEVRRR